MAEAEEKKAAAALLVLLVSPDYLASKEGIEELEALDKRDRRVLWVPVRPSGWQQTELIHIQPLHPAKQPLSTLPNEGAIEQALEEIARSIAQTLDEVRQDRLFLEADRLFTEFRRIRRAVDTLHRLAVLVLLLLVSIIASGWIYALRPLQQELARAKARIELQETFFLVQTATSTEEILKRVSLKLLNENDFHQVEHDLQGLQQLRAASSADDEDSILAVLSRINEGLLKLKDIRAGPRDDVLLQLDSGVTPAWKAISDGPKDEKLKDEKLKEFVKRLPAYRNNVLGILCLKRYEFSNRQTRPFLDDARKYFDEARRAYPEFARVHSNLGLVEAWKYEYEYRLQKQGPGIHAEQLRGFLDSAKESYQKARSYSDTAISKSITLNNLAMHYLREAKLQYELVNPRDAKAADFTLNAAIKYLETAKDLPNRHWMVFETWSQIEAYRLAVQKETIKALPTKERKDRLAAILNKLKIAAGESGDCRGYLAKLRADMERPDTEFSEFRNLSLLDRNFDWGNVPGQICLPDEP